MAKKVFSLGALMLTGAISLAGGVGIVMVVEDAYKVPLVVSPYPKLTPEQIMDFIQNFDPSQWADHIDELIDLLNDNPDLLDALIDEFQNNFNIEDYSVEELIALAQEYPEIAAMIAAQMGVDPSMVAAALGGMQRTEFGEEIGAGGMSGIEGPGGGGISGGIDNGSVDPDREPIPLFSYTTSYRGVVHLRSSSFGDYDPATRSMKDAPEWDGSSFMTTPLLYPGIAMEASFGRATQYTMYLHMDGHRDNGTIAPDYPSPYYGFEGRQEIFPYTHESRLRRLDMDEYSVTFYPEVKSISDYQLPQYVAENESRYRNFALKKYSKIDKSIAEEIHNYRVDNNLNSPNDIMRHFTGSGSEFTYEAHAMDCPPDQDIVVYFLNSKKGTCSNYASASMLLLRDLGYPARYVTGYMTYSASDDTTVNDTAAHAWTEYYINGYGWQQFDATPGNSDAPYEDPETKDDWYGGNPKVDGATLTDEQTAEAGWHFFRQRSYGDWNVYSKSFNNYTPAVYDSSFYEDAASESLFYASGAMSSKAKVSVFSLHATANFGKTEAVVPQYPVLQDGYELSPYYDAYFRFTEDLYKVGSYPMGSQLLASSSYDTSRYDGYATMRYTSVPSSTLEEISVWDANNKSDGTTDPAEVKKLLKEGVYTLPKIGESYGTIETLIRSDDASYGWSAAATLILRSHGRAARLTYGYRSKDSALGEEDRYYWLEAYYPGVGWRAFDMHPDHDINSSAAVEVPALDADPGETGPNPGQHKVTFECEDMERIYTGEDYYPSDSLISGTVDLYGLLNIYKYSVAWHKASHRMNAGSTSLVYTVSLYDADEQNLTPEFAIETKRGKLTIKPAGVTITTANLYVSVGETIDASSLIASSVGLLNGDYVVASGPTSYDAAGSYLNSPTITIMSLDGKDVTSNYDIRVNTGNIIVS